MNNDEIKWAINNIFKGMVAGLFVFVLCYLLGSFVEWNLNAGMWETEFRFFIGLFGTGFSVFTFLNVGDVFK